jgi:hypothetical protein
MMSLDALVIIAGGAIGCALAAIAARAVHFAVGER